jgi:hypothetical protein
LTEDREQNVDLRPDGTVNALVDVEVVEDYDVRFNGGEELSVGNGVRFDASQFEETVG